jgi:hypothetical protein
VTLFADEPTEPAPGEHSARCRRCRRELTDAESLGYSIGPVCRQRLGITSGPRVVRLARVRPCGDCDGQGDLLGEET